MYERFTDRARKVMQLANQEAQRFNHEYIGSEHVLLGLVKEGTGVAASAFKNLDVDLRRVRIETEKLVRSGPEMTTMGKLPQTPRTKKVIEYSMEEARNLNNAFVGTEHLLLGLIRVEEGVAYQVLTGLSLDIQKLRQETLKQNGSEERIAERKSRKANVKSKTPALDAFTRDITELAKEQKLKPVVGRVAEINRLITVLCRLERRNAILIGDAGVGRRSIVHGLAHQMIEDSPIAESRIADSRIVELDQGSFVAGTKYRGQFEERVKAISNEMRRAKNTILFAPQIHTLANLGTLEDSGLSAFEILKHSMASNEIRCIGTCTLDEYEKHILSDSSLQRLFQPILIQPPTQTETIEILRGIKHVYERYHSVEIADETLKAAVELSELYLPNDPLPDKAINLIDEAGSRLGLDNRPPDITEISRQVAKLREQVSKAVAAEDSENASRLQSEADALKDQLVVKRELWLSGPVAVRPVEATDVVAALSRETGISEQDIIGRKSLPNPKDA